MASFPSATQGSCGAPAGACVQDLVVSANPIGLTEEWAFPLEEDESAFALVAELLEFLLFLDEGCFSKASESLWEGMDWST